MTRNEDGELVDKRSYKAIQKIARIKRYITDATDTIYTLDEINIGKDDESPRYMDMNLYECTSCGARLMVKSTVRRAAEFSMKHETSGSLERFFEENETVTTDMTYGESWDFIKSGENSLKRHTNVNLLIKRLKAIAENHI
jgi:hypothetical protein